MIYTDNQWSLSNPGPDPILVWLEPWAEEFVVSAGSTITMIASGGRGLGDAEWSPDHLVVWTDAPTAEVVIDGRLQDSASATVSRSRWLDRRNARYCFCGQPSARLDGTFAEGRRRTSLWERIKRHLRPQGARYQAVANRFRVAQPPIPQPTTAVGWSYDAVDQMPTTA